MSSVFEKKMCNVLVLGASESGKSSFIHTMFSKDEVSGHNILPDVPLEQRGKCYSIHEDPNSNVRFFDTEGWDYPINFEGNELELMMSGQVKDGSNLENIVLESSKNERIIDVVIYTIDSQINMENLTSTANNIIRTKLMDLVVKKYEKQLIIILSKVDLFFDEILNMKLEDSLTLCRYSEKVRTPMQLIEKIISFQEENKNSIRIFPFINYSSALSSSQRITEDSSNEEELIRILKEPVYESIFFFLLSSSSRVENESKGGEGKIYSDLMLKYELIKEELQIFKKKYYESQTNENAQLKNLFKRVSEENEILRNSLESANQTIHELKSLFEIQFAEISSKILKLSHEKSVEINTLKNEVSNLSRKFDGRRTFVPEQVEEITQIMPNETFSSILTLEQYKGIHSEIPDFSETKWKRVYLASKDGFSSSSFHQKCDQYKGTLVVIQSDRRHVFGGYNPFTWSMVSVDPFQKITHLKKYVDNYYFDSKGAWVFGFGSYYDDDDVDDQEEEQEDGGEDKNRNKEHGAVDKNNYGFRKFDYSENKCGIYCNPLFGPTFGGGNDIYISNNCNINDSSYTRIGFGTDKDPGKTFFLNGGVQNFAVKEFEVFTRLMKNDEDQIQDN